MTVSQLIRVFISSTAVDSNLPSCGLDAWSYSDGMRILQPHQLIATVCIRAVCLTSTKMAPTGSCETLSLAMACELSVAALANMVVSPCTVHRQRTRCEPVGAVRGNSPAPKKDQFIPWLGSWNSRLLRDQNWYRDPAFRLFRLQAVEGAL